MIRYLRHSLCLLFVGCALGVSLAGCSRSSGVRVLSAEFQDETPDGVALQNETIRITLDKPLPPNVSVSAVQLTTVPPVEWTPKVLRTADPRILEVKIVAGTPAFRFAGVRGKDPASTALCADLGDGVQQTVELQRVPSLPVLERAIWEDRYPPEGNMVVDQGDCIRLLFDRPVTLRADGDAARALVPQDIILSKANSDRLEDGELHARFEKGDGDREIRIVLGSRPILTAAGELAKNPASIDRFKSSAPSGLALNGTAVIPMPKIVDARGGPGAISNREVDIELPQGFPVPRKRTGESFPPPGNRIFHTVTPIAGGRALVVGGAAAETRQAIDQVLVYDPLLAEAKPEQAFVSIGRPLPHPSQLHTATVLAGPDGFFGTFDDVVLVAGGTDGERALSDVTVLAPSDDGSVAVEPVEGGLRIPRAEHAAVAVGGNQILIDGGRKTDPDGLAGLVECAELITLAYDPDGKPRKADHQVFRTLARSLHTLTLLPPSADGEVLVLALGGFGRARRQGTPISRLGERVTGDDVFCSTDNAAVLASPILIAIAFPERSFELRGELLLELVRWGHVAVPIDSKPSASGPPRSSIVLIAGGSVRHPTRGFDGDRRLWELSSDVLDLRRPQEHEASSPILFRFDAANPRESRFEVLVHPSADPSQVPERLNLAAIAVPDRGVVLTGGELHDGKCLASAEIFLGDEQLFCDLAVRLVTGRSRHQAYAVTRGGRSLLFLIGGTSCGADAAGLSAVEELPLK